MGLTASDVGVPVHLKALALADVIEERVEDIRSDSEMQFRWVWIALIGIFVIAAAAAWIYCRARGYRGFEGHMEALRGPWGVKIGIKLGCY